jgi:hypothetical protein
VANIRQPPTSDQRMPRTLVSQPAASDAPIITMVMGAKTAAIRKPSYPATSARYSAVKMKIAKVAK